jgi:galactose mutarotase-like enzyme
MSFADSDASGWDECLPSVAECTVATAAGQVSIPDHGDLWRIPWQVLEITEDSATLRAKCFSLPLQLTRTILLTQTEWSTSPAWKLQLLYSLTNLGAYAIPWSWSAHPLFATSPGDRLILPDTIQTLRLEGSAQTRLGHPGDQVRWPNAQLTDGTQFDLSIAQPPDTGYGDKLFAGPITSPQSARATLERPGTGLRLTVSFDPALTPYLGLWICFGGWPETAGNKQVCIAIEPSTAPVDALATHGDWSRLLDAGDTVNWPMQLDIESIEKV